MSALTACLEVSCCYVLSVFAGMRYSHGLQYPTAYDSPEMRNRTENKQRR